MGLNPECEDVVEGQVGAEVGSDTDGVALFQVEMCFGVLMFVRCMLLNTKQIIEKAVDGDKDYLKHALLLFLNFTSASDHFIFIMVLAQMALRMRKSMV
ncbi:bax inhibitor 1 [Lactuca sativa]|uniref:Uncharacterized protein n=1 Tax=Lactuca sativa TaxID=4236 RepID=A0A9R1V3L8_LACSA|nr:bax inhibitor 1 [Lactuca sativa]KAJ0197763.1 hypothetical protein LSAT_V11C700351450 [Lactuca sativa]